MKKLLLSTAILFAMAAQAQNVGVGTNNPKSKLDIKGGVTIGNSYSGANAAPANGAIIEGHVGVGTASPNAKSALDITSTTAGMLIPRLTTTQRDALTPTLTAAEDGLLIYNSTDKRAQYWDGAALAWKDIGNGVGGPPSGAAGGDLTGSYPNPTIAPGAVNGGIGGDIQDGSITTADLATPAVNATNQIFNTLPVGNGGTGTSTTPINGQLLIGNGSNYSVAQIGAGAGISVTNGPGSISIANTGDLSATNEGALTVGAGTATTSVINSNTSGSTPVTLQAGSNVTLSESGNTITIASSNSGGTVTNVATGAGLTGGPITTSGTISIPNGGVTNTMLQNSGITVGTSGVGLSGGTTVPLGGTVTIASNATSANTGNTIVSRDASGNFSAGLVSANLNGQWLRVDDRNIAPADISSGYAKFGFTSWDNNNSSPYADFLHLRSYTDASGGNDNLVMFRKDQIGMRVYQQAWNSATAYSSFKDVAFVQDLTTNLAGNYVDLSTDQTAGGNKTWTGSHIYSNNTPFQFTNTGTGTYNKAVMYANTSGITFERSRVSDASNAAITDFQINQRGGGTPALMVKGSGNVGIGTAIPNQKLEVNGNVRITGLNANAVVRSNSSGDLSAINFTSASDVLRGDGTFGAVPGEYRYTLPNTGGTSQWVKLGTLTIPQNGNSAYITVVTNTGYNASTSQNCEVHIRFKTSNVSSVDANGFAGDASYFVTGLNAQFANGSNIKFKANAAGGSATAYDLYMNFGAYTGNGSFYTVETTVGSWSNSGATGQSDPGAASSSVLIPAQEFNAPGISPIGSIIAWHKSMSNTPGLPSGWVECNGQTLSDAGSPYNGQVIPNLNGTFTTESGGASAAGRFLRGSYTSGALQNDQTNSVTEMLIQDNGGGQASQRSIPDNGGWSAAGYNYYTTASNDGIKLRKKGVETKPGAMTVVWIMRVK